MRVSVIIPTYNAARTILATLQSARQQTHQNLEIIVVDDGCTDKTMEIVEQQRREDGRIRIVQQVNSGVCVARHRALYEASGDFIATLDADDIWHPTKIEKQLIRLIEAPADVMAVYCWSRRIDEDDNILSTLPAVRAEGFILCQHVYDNVIGNGSNLMVRREAAIRVGGYRDDQREPKTQSADDHLLQLRLATQFRYVVVPEYLVGYRVVGGSVSSNKEQLHLSIMRNLEIIKSMTPHVPDWVYRWSRAASLFDQLGFNWRQRNFSAMLRTAVTAFCLDPTMCVDRLRLGIIKAVHADRHPQSRQVRKYYDVSPTANIVEDNGLHRRRMRQLSELDQEIFRTHRKKFVYPASV
ncbi:Undecaprenyl-phosphate 4-deoxy-4-formamido-L-arabinose transferase (plasmid) [Asticcacaulis sp. MM231]|uniref:glycosyltransferase family 2 protein n=1 Tax=Asticcacaulis sp. MM231 TaxID=3157666 RepID=UPI0032D594AC